MPTVIGHLADAVSVIELYSEMSMNFSVYFRFTSYLTTMLTKIFILQIVV